MLACAKALLRGLFKALAACPAPRPVWPIPAPPLGVEASRWEAALLYTRPRFVDTPRPLPRAPVCVLPRPLPRGTPLPLADDMAVSGEGIWLEPHL